MLTKMSTNIANLGVLLLVEHTLILINNNLVNLFIYAIIIILLHEYCTILILQHCFITSIVMYLFI